MSKTAASRTVIEDHRWLLAVFGASRIAPVMALAALLALGLGWLGFRGGAGAAEMLLLALVGAVYWSFCEYALHRWFYHWRPANRTLRRIVESFHVYHHRTPDDRAVWNAGPALVLLLTAGLSLPPLLALRDVTQTACLMTGAVIAYAIYEHVHRQCHAREHTRGPLAYLQAFHLHHHRRDWRRNFGVTTPVWDWLFGTLARREG